MHSQLSIILKGCPLQSETTLPTDPDHAKKYHLAEADPQWHGDSGPIAKSYALYFGWGPLNDRVISAVKELGVTHYPDTVCRRTVSPADVRSTEEWRVPPP